jgi:hypothetical protein
VNRTIPPTVGALACLATLVAVLAPYLLLPAQETAGLGVYYRFGVVGPWAVALFALVGAVAFLSGREARADPGLVAGATLVVGVAMVLAALQWALAVDTTVLQSITTADWIDAHRWLVAGAAAVVPVAATWYARAVGLV